MRAVIQRVSQAKVTVDSQTVGQIDRGLLVYLSIANDDTPEDAKFIADKLVDLRIFEDSAGKMNLSVQDINGGLLIISNFTLHGDCRKGRRPGFDQAGRPELAKQLYEQVVELIRVKQMKVEKGTFAEHMHVSSVNDGPVNFLLDSKRLF